MGSSCFSLTTSFFCRVWLVAEVTGLRTVQYFQHCQLNQLELTCSWHQHAAWQAQVFSPWNGSTSQQPPGALACSPSLRDVSKVASLISCLAALRDHQQGKLSAALLLWGVNHRDDGYVLLSCFILSWFLWKNVLFVQQRAACTTDIHSSFITPFSLSSRR